MKLGNKKDIKNQKRNNQNESADYSDKIGKVSIVFVFELRFTARLLAKAFLVPQNGLILFLLFEFAAYFFRQRYIMAIERTVTVFADSVGKIFTIITSIFVFLSHQFTSVVFFFSMVTYTAAIVNFLLHFHHNIYIISTI